MAMAKYGGKDGDGKLLWQNWWWPGIVTVSDFVFILIMGRLVLVLLKVKYCNNIVGGKTW